LAEVREARREFTGWVPQRDAGAPKLLLLMVLLLLL